VSRCSSFLAIDLPAGERERERERRKYQSVSLSKH
jgi:hypothetical protein